MIVPATIRRRYERDEAALEIVARKVLETVLNYSLGRGFAVAGRQKDFQSLAEKLETGRYRKWSELDDLYACKIIIPTLLEEPETLSFLVKVFDPVRISKRGSTKKRPDVFRFDSTRFVGRLRNLGSPAVDAIYDIPFEVQVVTAFEHAWSTTTHSLAYKSGDLDWRTRRIASQLRAVVEQLDMIVLGAGDATSHLDASPCPELAEQNAILEGFRGLIEDGTIPEELAPSKWSRFAENVHSLIDDHRRNRSPSKSKSGPAEILAACRKKAAGYTVATFPRLVSLHQFALGSLLEENVISLPLNRYTPLLTDELRQVFPSLENASGGFELEQ
ncbi:MAG: RelA/SpoT domain-containing protein [Planctomycetaceae bacterium]